METTQTRRNFLKAMVAGGAALATGCATVGRQNASLKQFIADYRAAKANKETPAAAIKAYETALEQAFNDAELHLYIGFDTRHGKNRKLIALGKGAQYKADFPDLDSKITLLERAYTAQMAAKESPEAVLQRGLFVKNYDTAIPAFISRAKDGTFGDQYVPHSYLDKRVWDGMLDGKVSNGELRGSPAHVLVYATHSGAVSLDAKVK